MQVEEDKILKKESNIETENKYKRSKFRKILLSVLVLMYLVVLPYMILHDDYISKNDIQNQIVKAINNNADIDVVKNIYKNRKNIYFGSLKRIFGNKEYYYHYDTLLSTILDDIKTEFYLINESKNIDINKTNQIIKNYLITNPYDSLEVSQKDMFTDIRLKIDKKIYSKIQTNLEKIANELTQKNNLVNQYLKDSTNSFWISISALIFSAILGFVQLYYAREERQRQIISDELKRIENNTNNTPINDSL